MKRVPCIFLLVLLIFSQKINAQNLSDFDKVTYKIGNNSIAPIISKVTDSIKIVGLGESSHYTKEYYQYKNLIINDLLRNRSFEAVIFEVDFGTALLWDEYVTKGIGNIDSILTDCSWWTYQTKEFKQVLEDIKTINGNRPQKIRIFGMEMTYIPGVIDLIDSFYLENYEGVNKDIILKQLHYVRDSIDLMAFTYHNVEEINVLLELNDLVYSSIEEFNDNNLDLSNLRIANNILNQFITYVTNRNQYAQLKLRDQFSFTNIQWFTYMNAIDKFVIWAHSGHIQNTYHYPQLGLYLKQEYKDKYHSIGFDYGTGENGSRTPNQILEGLSFELELNSASFYLYNNYDSDLYVNLIEARNNSLLNFPVIVRNTLSEYTDIKTFNPNRNLVLPEINDGMIFIRNTSLPTKISE